MREKVTARGVGPFKAFASFVLAVAIRMFLTLVRDLQRDLGGLSLPYSSG
jgi:hypothetical protein